MNRLPGYVYHAPADYGARLEAELARAERPVTSVGSVHFLPGERLPTYWHQNVWLEPCELTFRSIADAAEQLRSLGALWAGDHAAHFRKAALIQEKLPRLPTRARSFPFALPSGPVGAWSLKDETTLWASPTTTSPFPGGRIRLEENHVDPPSTAYLKLQEALVLYGRLPERGDVCLDAGSSPGGWTWVLANLGARVVSVDRAPLDPRLAQRPNVEFRQGSAFALRPQDLPEVEWLFCDVICYPDKLWTWLQAWLAAGTVRHFVVTVKMQGESSHQELLDRFAAVPGSRLVHLHHNKHELTWLL